GRHHCKRERASGFCYVNDIVLGILELNKTFSRVLYVDLDLHHGDGVQDAFLYSNKVMTLSFHHFDRGFYPNSGGIPVEGKGKGKGFSLNVPLMQGTTDSSFLQAFEEVMKFVWLSFEPQAVVVQCGSDGLAGDPYKVFNLTTDAFAGAIKSVLEWDIPTLVLGGGGYSSVNCARCWTRLTAIACGQDIAVSADIPDHKFYTEYVPACSMAIDKRLVPDENTPESIADTLNQIMLRPH
ncbi:Histone deacetylase 8, partial [Linderina macrospora]